MPFLTSESEWCELRFGANLLGGRGDGSVGISHLAPMPPTALLLVRGEAAPVIRRLPSRVEIRVDGELLGSAPMELYDGSHIQIAGCRLVFTLTAEGIVLPKPPASAPRASKEVAAGAIDAADISAWSFRELRTGRTIAIPKAGMLVGRSEECLLIVPGRGVSRRHAIVEPSPAGFSITDQSSNGTLVNGIPCRERHALHTGDVVRIGDEDYRIENGGVAGLPASESQRPTEVMPAVPGPTEAKTIRPEPLASLQVTRGPLRGTHFSIERPVCAIGRAVENDVRLSDQSVSAAHATLMLKAGTWYVSDLRSTSGTYVDGYRVAGDRALSPGCTLSIGDVTMVFRSRRAPLEAPSASSTGFFKKLHRLMKSF